MSPVLFPPYYLYHFMCVFFLAHSDDWNCIFLSLNVYILIKHSCWITKQNNETKPLSSKPCVSLWSLHTINSYHSINNMAEILLQNSEWNFGSHIWVYYFGFRHAKKKDYGSLISKGIAIISLSPYTKLFYVQYSF